jgi:hypothetical protein
MSNKILFVAFALALAVSISPATAAQTIGNWVLNTDAGNAVTSMTINNPATYLNIESVVTIGVDNQGMPQKGTVKFRNGLERPCTPEEVTYFWDNFKGFHSIWEYFASENRVDLFNPDQAQLPASMYGKFSRITTKAGVEYFGKLVEFTTNPDWFVVQIGNANVTMYRHAIAAVQQLK